jgi:hypothetical protein
MNTNVTATLTTKKAATKGSPSAAAGLKTPGQPKHVTFADHDDSSSAPPGSKKTPGPSASAIRKRTEKLGAPIVELIESRMPNGISTSIFTLAMEMLTANAYVTECAKRAQKFDTTTLPTDDKEWLPSNIKNINICLKTSKLKDDDEYIQLAAKCKDNVEKFKVELNDTYYQLATMELKHAEKERLSTFLFQAHNLFRDYTLYYSECLKIGKTSRPLEQSAAVFLSRFFDESLHTLDFFHGYLKVTRQEGLDALAVLVPGYNVRNEAAVSMDTEGESQGPPVMTTDDEKIYKMIRDEVGMYFHDVTKGVQEKTDTVRHQTEASAMFDALKKANQTDDATAACAAALHAIPTVTPATMEALVEMKVTKKFQQLARKLGKNEKGSGKAKSTQPKKGASTKSGGTDKKQSGKKRTREFSKDTSANKKQRITGKKPNTETPPKNNRSQPRSSSNKGKSGKRNRDDKRKDGEKRNAKRRK